MLIEIADYTYFEWTFLVSLILVSIGLITSISVYNQARTRPHLYLVIFMVSFVMLVIGNLMVFDSSDVIYASLGGWGNRFGWLTIYLIGFELVKESEKEIPIQIRMFYYINTLIVFALTFYTLYFTSGPYREDIYAFDAYNIYAFHIYSFLATAMFLYCVAVTPTVNPRSQRVKWMWHFGLSSWSIYYVVNFIGLAIDNPLDADFLLSFYIFSTLAMSYIIIFVPENLFISRNIILQACKLYARVHTYEGRPLILGFNKIKDYLLSIPEEIWEKGCVEMPEIIRKGGN